MNPDKEGSAPRPADAGSPDKIQDYSPGQRHRMLFLLAVATAVGSAGLAAGGTAGALLAERITGTEAAAGVPLGVLVGGQAIAALLISTATVRLGRGRSLALGYAMGVAGAALVILAAVESSFLALLAGSAVLGAGNAAVFLTRYAVADVGENTGRGTALGIVLFAAALGAIASPNLLGPSGGLARLLNLPQLAGLYVIAVPCFSVAALLLAFGSGAAPPKAERKPLSSGRDIVSALRSPAARASFLVLAAANIVMVAVMAIAPVHLLAHDHGLGLIGVIVAVHVAGMFLPSPVSGWLADRVGSTSVAVSGLAFISASCVAGSMFDMGKAYPIMATLLVLGVGWNLAIVGGSAMLVGSVPTALRPHAEGFGELSMGLAAAAGAPAAGLVVALNGFAALSLTGAVVATTVAILLMFISQMFW